MRTITFILLLALIPFLGIAQTWSKEQLTKANTVKDIDFLTDAEKEAILYINLARLYPKDFASIVVANYFGTERYGDYLKDSEYRKSLITHLNSMQPVGALVFEMELYENAKCFAKEQGEAGTIGHDRINCPKGNYAECCSYGMDKGIDIAMQWLIDDKVPSLGHRINCLNGSYTKVGISVNYHKAWQNCAVADFIW